jgi:large subunit ribosomal protein L3
MKVILGQKLGMSQVFTGAGDVVPVTLIAARPNAVTLRRNKDKDGYAAVQLALPRGEGEFVAKREFKTEVEGEKQEVTVEQFAPGDVVQVTGISKGKGFQGVVKLHGMKGGPASHGHTDWARKAGSIGSRFGQHTMKGKRMAGRMGGDQVTVKNLEVVRVDGQHHLLALKGAVPGVRGSVVAIQSVEN